MQVQFDALAVPLHLHVSEKILNKTFHIVYNFHIITHRIQICKGRHDLISFYKMGQRNLIVFKKPLFQSSLYVYLSRVLEWNFN